MTALALNYSMKGLQIVKAILTPFAKALKSLSFAIACSRQIQANQMIAQHMIVEYPHHTIASLTHELNMRSLDALKKEWYND